MLTKIRTNLPILIILISINNVFGQPSHEFTTEEKEVLDIVHLFFESMTKRDTTTLRTIMTEDGRYYGLDEKDDNWSVHTSSHENYIQGLSSGTDLLQERIWDPVIKVHKTIAMVWAPYDIWINGKFLHCGIDAFSLIKTKEGWKIASTIFTMEPDGCSESPLGPIKSE